MAIAPEEGPSASKQDEARFSIDSVKAFVSRNQFMSALVAFVFVVGAALQGFDTLSAAYARAIAFFWPSEVATEWEDIHAFPGLWASHPRGWQAESIEDPFSGGFNVELKPPAGTIFSGGQLSLTLDPFNSAISSASLPLSQLVDQLRTVISESPISKLADLKSVLPYDVKVSRGATGDTNLNHIITGAIVDREMNDLNPHFSLMLVVPNLLNSDDRGIKYMTASCKGSLPLRPHLEPMCRDLLAELTLESPPDSRPLP